MKKHFAIGGLAAAVSVAAALLATTGVFAHAHYESSVPAKGAVLDSAPDEVSITFAEPVQKIGLSVKVNRDGGGSATDTSASKSATDGHIVAVSLKPSLSDGRYVVEWTNVSDDDGDAAEGAFSFYVGVEPTADQLADDAELEKVGEEEEEMTPTAAPAAPTSTPAAAGSTPVAQPTAKPSGVVAPSTGTGSGGSSDGNGIVGLAALAAIGLAVTGAGIKIGRRS